ncbi:hypothetical protein [Janibacter terrae]|uniref:hypothetical protein n=1 Tax=Janibacter terrae TaxID=103817 RepID=UPI0008361253|nr:hypothetical protein [Janibacter terrae]
MIDVTETPFAQLLTLPDGIFTRQEALGVGLRDEVLIAGVRRGVIRRLCRGAYTSPGARTKGEERRLLARAALRMYPDAVLVGVTAAAAHGIPLFEVPVVPADLARPIQREASTRHIRLRPLRDTPLDTPWGPATDTATALIQICLDHGVLPGVASIDAALNAQRVDVQQLQTAFERVSGWPHAGRARCALAWSDGDAESLGESVTRAILLGAGFRVVSQLPIADRDGVVFARVDLGIEDTPVLLEFDGKVKYSDGGPDALFREKKREDRIRARGYIVIRVVWADLFHPERIIRAVMEALARVA